MSLVGFRARNHPQQPVDDATDDRRTPSDLFARLHDEHNFTVDAAASPANALLPRFWTRANDGVTQDWSGERVWCNPPYSEIERWVRKAHESSALVVMILPANRPEQGWWQRWIEPFRDQPGGRLRTKFLAGRLRFGHPENWTKPKKGDRPPFGIVVCTWSARP